MLARNLDRTTSRLTSELKDEKGRRAALEREAVNLHRVGVRLHQEHQFTTHFLSEFPHVTRELHSRAGERKIPGILLNIVQRILEPRQAVILVRRRRTLTDVDRSAQLLVAAVHPPDGPINVGTEIAVGHGEIGFVAEVQRAMARTDFEAQTPVTRLKLKQESLPGFQPDLAAPMVFAEETVGVIAIAQPRHDYPHSKAVLRVIAQTGALAIHDVTAYSEMKVTADVDGLTGVFNKRHMTQTLGEEIFRAQQKIESLSIFLFDVDNFKNYNDVNGHVAGDTLLQLLARLARENTRKENIFGRFGGEEFLLILPNARAQQAMKAAENIRARIEAHAFPFGERQPKGFLSISGGVAEYPRDALDSVSLLKAADTALYEAKKEGRNRVLQAVTRYLDEEQPQATAEDNGARPEDDKASEG